jgi:hypothetical protein
MKHFLAYEIAKKLKEQGFNEPCLMVYYGEGTGSAETGQPKDKLYLPSGFGKVKNSDLKNYPKQRIYHEGQVAAPLYQQVIDWFREQHGVFINVDWREYIGWHYKFNGGNLIQNKFATYYDALNAGIEEAVNQLTIINRHK